MKTNIKKLLITGIVLSVFTSCKKDDVGPPNPGNYIVAVSPVASTGVADYLLTAASLDEGSVTTKGHGVEQDGTYRYYMTANNKFFSMLYGQGNPGAVTTYDIKNGMLNKVSDFQSETVQAFAPVNNDILLMKISRSITNKLSNFYIVNTNSLLITGEGTINNQIPSSNGELAHFTWIRQFGDKVFAPYMSIKGCCGDSFGTAYPDSSWIAVYSYPKMELEKVIKDNRTSYIGAYFLQLTRKVICMRFRQRQQPQQVKLRAKNLLQLLELIRELQRMTSVIISILKNCQEGTKLVIGCMLGKETLWYP